MNGIGEVAADVASGAVLARAVEPPAGESADGHTHESACLNCGTGLLGSHCHACGQAAHVHKTIGAFFHDLLHGVFHFEGKIWRTVPLLAWRPGRLTREYIDGRRASYVSPIALFLFAVFLLFAMAKGFGGNLGDSANVEVNGKSIAGLAANDQELARLKALRATLESQGRPTSQVDGEISGREEGLKILRGMNADAETALKTLPVENASSSIPAIDHAIRQARTNPQLALYKLENYSYKYSWALIPLSVPFVWLLFPFSRRFGVYDHTVFVTYSLSFMTLLAAALVLLRAAHIPGMASAFVLIAPWHIYRQLRGTYALCVPGALWRTAAILIVAFFTLSAFAMFLFYETAA